MHDNRDAFEADIGFDQLGQHIAVHFRHFRIHQNDFQVVVQALILTPGAAGQHLQALPRFAAIGGLLELDAHFFQHTGDLLARHHRVIHEEQVLVAVHLRGRNFRQARFAHHRGQNLLHVQNGNQLAVFQFGNGGDQVGIGGAAAVHHVFRGAHAIPVHPDDAVHRVHQESLGTLVEFGDDHGVEFAAALLGADKSRQRNHRNDIAAQRQHTLHAKGHVGGFGDGGGLGHLAHLEHIDAEGFTGSQGKQQDFHLVGAGKLGAGVHAGEQGCVGC